MPELLGIECGATHTVALHESAGQVIRAGFGPANLRLLNDTQLARHLRQIAKQFPKPSAVAIGMAGARTNSDKLRLRRAATRAWPSAAIHATNDLETALAADTQRTPATRVLVLSGTGSCCFGPSPAGATALSGASSSLLRLRQTSRNELAAFRATANGSGATTRSSRPSTSASSRPCNVAAAS